MEAIVSCAFSGSSVPYGTLLRRRDGSRGATDDRVGDQRAASKSKSDTREAAQAVMAFDRPSQVYVKCTGRSRPSV